LSDHGIRSAQLFEDKDIIVDMKDAYMDMGTDGYGYGNGYGYGYGHGYGYGI